LNYNLLTQEFYEVQITPATAGTYQMPKNNSEFLAMNYSGKAIESKEVTEIDMEQLQVLLQGNAVSVIDVREPHELPAIAKITSIKIPMSVFNKEIENFTPQHNIVLICQHGIRSITAGHALREKYGSNRNIYSLKGGVARWNSFL